MRNETKELVEVALFDGINLVALFAFDLDFAFNKNAFEKKLVAI